MNRMKLMAASLLAAAALGMPMLAWSQSPPPPPGRAGPGGPGGPDRDGPGRDGPDRGMHRGWERWARVSPQQACIDRVARRAGFVAATGVKLNLTAEQKPLWDKLVTATQAAQDSEKQACAALPATADARDKETLIDRMHHRQAMMQVRLQALQQTEPAVEALYQALSPDQKAMVDRPFHRG